MKVMFTVKQKDRNDLPCMLEFEKQVYGIKKQMVDSLGEKYDFTIETSFDQASVLYPKRFMFDYVSETAVCHHPMDVISAFFKAIESTGICISKYDVHITVEWM
ncbi:hypothetical protein CUJ83_11805 [Methanocella sp. CWC-04]|uniref:Uncharacterized protein n=1 Tax=Methanooceanicella nereidis TaxID=2052831 RepID=A0AAP2RG86_9EURY|nr:hypothetical protein [Methanocella sp. CWC-04]MCD1295682.1 hypothetical protein [Methanocella sp. CWC-04]